MKCLGILWFDPLQLTAHIALEIESNVNSIVSNFDPSLINNQSRMFVRYLVLIIKYDQIRIRNYTVKNPKRLKSRFSPKKSQAIIADCYLIGSIQLSGMMGLRMNSSKAQTHLLPEIWENV